ncbi:MAG: pyruvate dehydrogenase (acetyl-transferring) E1 component subunit alpha [Anaerolineales bacterium]|nr:pyruvate dehydrogenase (acetyl-transferring) E1 component subunit alpha [Anaerolineales bacterium]
MAKRKQTIDGKPVSKPTPDSFKERVDDLGLKDEQLIEMYRTMCVIRSFENMADKLYQLGRVHGTMHLCIGQEAVAVGAARAVRPDDYLINHHRGHGHFIAKGSDINRMMAEFMGKDSGFCRGRGGSMHIVDMDANNLGANGIVGGGIPIAVGVGLALQMQGHDQIVTCMFGDGAANEGTFHESLNMAALWKLPVLFLCENNQYGMSMAVGRATALLPIAKRADAYGIPGHRVDGNDLLSVFDIVRKAANQARAGEGPILVEAETYRWKGHSKSDRNLYRTQEEMDAWKKRDPIARFRESLIAAKILSEARTEEITLEAQKTIEEALAYADASPDPEEQSLTDFVYA